MQHFIKRKEKLMRKHSKTRLHWLLVGHHASAWWSDIQNVKTHFILSSFCVTTKWVKSNSVCVCVCVCVCVYTYIYIYIYYMR